jgi:roadblock/LC7 domain-containing protein
MAWTETQLSALESAIASGTTRVTHDGKTVEYRSIAEMIQIRNMMRADLGQASTAPRSTLVRFDRGF